MSYLYISMFTRGDIVVIKTTLLFRIIYQKISLALLARIWLSFCHTFDIRNILFHRIVISEKIKGFDEV